MPVMSTNPTASLKGHLDQWAATQVSCEPADRRGAEEGVRLAYLGAALPPPKTIAWCGGPMEIATQLASPPTAAVIGANVRAELYDDLRGRIDALAEILWKEVVVAAMEMAAGPGHAIGDYDKCRLVCDAVNQLVNNAANETLGAPRARARHLLRRMRGQPWLLPKGEFEGIAIGPSQLLSLGIYEYLNGILPAKDLMGSLRGFWRLGRCASWIVPYEHTCWISERPTLLQFDERGRLHCVDGPALRYRDGWSVYAWKGVSVPAWMIEHPERINLSTIDAAFEPVLRNCMIDIMTPERFVESGAPRCVSHDHCGTLWRKDWTHRGSVIDTWAAVEVLDGTANVDGIRRRYFLRVPSGMQTAQEAVAWTYGLTAREYARLELRT